MNAAHAIAEIFSNGNKGKGLIEITTYQEGSDVVITIADNGPGVSKENSARIFDPFFTTKDIGKGTGQGLAIAYTAIVENHGGNLTFESEMGKGTEFIIRLPIEGKKTQAIVTHRMSC